MSIAEEFQAALNASGCTLERHWREVEKSEKDPNYKPYYGKYNLREKLTSKAFPWCFRIMSIPIIR